MLFLIEFVLTVVALAVASVFPHLGATCFERVEELFSRLAHRRKAAVVAVGLSALAVRMAALPFLPIPQPGVHDEFSYILAGDTFAHGRMTNPAHPMWRHFETFHVIQQPTYASKYPPAQGLVLAAGQLVVGDPFWGVWLSAGLMCATLCWMLQAWLPPGWALFGGFLAVVRLAAFSYWNNSYWGGAVAALGGCLVLGALPRLKQWHRPVHAILMAVGFGILANSRPYEGLILSLPVTGALLFWICRSSRLPAHLLLRNILLPLSVVIATAGVTTGYYFWRVTGNPFRMPYQVYQATYDTVPYFVWESARPLPTYNNPWMLVWELGYRADQFNTSRSVIGFLSATLTKGIELGSFYFGPLFIIMAFAALAVAPFNLTWRHINSETRFLLLITGISLLGTMLTVYSYPHYIAPITCVFYALLLRGMRYVRNWGEQCKRPLAIAAVRSVALICIAMLALRVATPARLLISWPATWCSISDQLVERSRIMSTLQETSGSHLVIVRYSPKHDVDHEWVYNAADIEGAKVVWARDLGPAGNEELIKYFKDRRVWLVEPDQFPPRLTPYSGSVPAMTFDHPQHRGARLAGNSVAANP